MKPAVAAVFSQFTETFEGRTSWPYLDVKGLVTTGCGNLIDPIDLALPLPWQIGDYAAIQSEIRSQWEAVKAQPPARRAGWYAQFATMRLSDAAIDRLVLDKSRMNDAVLSSRFGRLATGGPDDGGAFWGNLPANVQLVCHSLAWACGPHFDFPNFMQAVAGGDWATARDECGISVAGNLGVVPRNGADRALMQAVVDGCDPDAIVGWP